MEEKLRVAGRQLANLDPSLWASSVSASACSLIISFNPCERVCNTENVISTERMRLGLRIGKGMGQGREKKKKQNPGKLCELTGSCPLQSSNQKAA